MKQCFSIFLFIFVLFLSHSDACLTFCFQYEKTLIYGRNFDWDVDVGAVFVNQRNISKKAFVAPSDIPVSWVSKYGSITFNQFSKEVPIGGMNEEGLVIECLVSSAEYPLPDKRPAINELQWIQYHLDTCRSVEEVIESAKQIRISQYAVNLHYFMTDSTGESAAVEHTGGKITFRTGKRLPIKVLANTNYDRSLKISGANANRFNRSASIIRQYNGQKNPVAFAFSTLDAVSQGDYTKWQIVYDIPNRHIWFRTKKSHATKEIALSNLNFEQLTDTLVIDVNIDSSGSIERKFQTYTQKFNDKLTATAFKEFKTAGILQHITAEHVEYIRKVVASYTHKDIKNVSSTVEEPQ